MDRNLRILLVDDDEDDYLLTRGLVSECDWARIELEWASSYELAQEAMQRSAHDLFLVDYRLGEKSGLDLLKEAVSSGCKSPIILLTGQGDHEVDIQAMRIGAADYLVKGQITPALLERSIRHAVERAHSTETLRRNEERFRLLIENAHGLLTIVEADGTIRYESPSVSRVLGYSPDEIIGTNLFTYVHPDDAPELRRTLGRICSKPGFGPAMEFRSRHRDGSWRCLESVGNNLLDDPGVGGIVLNSRDVSERKRAEELLRRSELEYRNLFESANDAIIIFEPETEIILEANSQACETYGFTRDELVGKSLKELTRNVARGEQQVYSLLRTRACRNFETVHHTKDGTPLDILANSAVIEYGGREAILSINRNVTDRKRLQLQLIQSEKMAALGQLVSGVAHELNNPLTSVIGYTQLLLSLPSMDPQVSEKLEIISREGERTRRIVNNLLSFSRQHKPSRTEVDLNELLTRSLELRAYEMRVSNLVAKTEYGRIPKVPGDEHQLHQVFMNIIVNAEQAIRALKKSGTLSIKTEVGESAGNEMVFVSIADNGPGILPEHLDKIFDPFFTTKPVGKGTGLGLSISYGIVKEHGGNLRVEGEAGGGARFVVELPVVPSGPPIPS